MHNDKMMRAIAFTPISEGRWGIPVLDMGPPGVGKTSAWKQFARLWNPCALEIVIASMRDPTDFAGLPIPDEHGRVRLAAPPFAERLSKERFGFLVLDEITQTPPAVQGPLMRIIHEGIVGDAVLPPGIRIAACANPAEQAAGGWDLALPLMNRFCRLDFEVPTLAAWSTWMAQDGGTLSDANAKQDALDPFAEERRVLARFPAEFGQAHAAATGYLHSRPNALLMIPSPRSKEARQGFPTPRSWELAVRCLATSRIHELDDASRDALLQGCIGEKTASELLDWLQSSDLPNMFELLCGREKWTPNPHQPDRIHAVIEGCSSVLIRHGQSLGAAWRTDPEHVGMRENFFRLGTAVMSFAPDILHPAIQAVINAKGMSIDAREMIRTGGKAIVDRLYTYQTMTV